MDRCEEAPNRVRTAHAAPVAPKGAYVLYWMVGTRRLAHNFALDRAVAWARRLGRPLLVFEPLRCDYRWASARIHRFVLDGMAEHRRALASGPAGYYPYVEPRPGAGRGLLRALAADACVVVTDEFPCFFLPRMVRAAAEVVPVRLEAVDSYGLLPLRAAERAHPTAYSFRRFLQRTLPEQLRARPRAQPFAGPPLPPAPAIPRAVAQRWPVATAAMLAGDALATIAFDHAVAPAATPGGRRAGLAAWHRFRETDLGGYLRHRRDPSSDGTSGLSPYLHFGHLSAHEVFWDLMEARGWEIDDVAGAKPGGHRDGWWRVDPPEEAFLDQLVTWRELGANTALHRRGFDRFGSLPDWARRTLAEHEDDPREPRYTKRKLEAARTHDELWNATQRQLAREGRIHNALRMLWGKKILEWSATPRIALTTMVHLNNKYALDGRDPNSYAGIFWVLGRYDRPWGPERPVLGKVRYLSSANTARKLRTAAYLERYR